MQEILQGNAALIEALGALCTRDKAIHHSTDAYGNAFHWFRLDHPRFMSQAATALQGAHARLSRNGGGQTARTRGRAPQSAV